MPLNPTESSTGFLLVIAAGSGTGKSTVCQALLETHPNVSISRSYTTRTPRNNEVDGDHYYFVSAEAFQQMINEDALLEWAEIHGQRYGTGREATLQVLAQGRDLLLDIDVQGARSIRSRFGADAILIFLLPPSWDEMHRRLKGRGTEKEEQIQRRLETARVELPVAREFDYLVINDDLDRTVETIWAIRQAEACRRQRMEPTLKQILSQIPPTHT